MSEAPRRIASSITLLTNRTMGASSTSSRLTLSSISSSPPVTSSDSRSTSSSPTSGWICASTCSRALSGAFCSLSSSTEDRQDTVLRDELVIRYPDRFQVETDRVQVEQRDAEFVRCRYRNVARARRATRDELGDDIGMALLRRVHGLQHGRLFYDPVLHEALRQAAQAGTCASQR